jgi:hypothetical protein
LYTFIAGLAFAHNACLSRRPKCCERSERHFGRSGAGFC